MALQIYLSSGVVPVEETDPTDTPLEWGGFAIPVFQYAAVGTKKLYIRDMEEVIDNPEDPIENQTTSETYPTFYVQSVTLTSSIEPFVSYDVTTQFYTNTGVATGWFDVAGIVVGTEYDYFKVFDQAQVSYLPFESAYDAAPSVNVPFPEGAVYDPENNQYPVDSVFTAMQDGRTEVDAPYTLTVVWSTLSMEDTDETQTTRFTTSFSLVEPCTQSGDSGVALQTLLAQSSFVAGYRPIRNQDGTNDPWTWGTEPVSVSFD